MVRMFDDDVLIDDDGGAGPACRMGTGDAVEDVLGFAGHAAAAFGILGLEVGDGGSGAVRQRGEIEGVGCGRLGFRFELELMEFEVEAGSERMVKEVREGMGKSLKVFVDGDLDIGGELEVEREVEEGEEVGGGTERTIRFVMGSAV